ncbi:hypothetical protein ACVWXP_007439 [Bradyrhizobium sp. USDA 4463]
MWRSPTIRNYARRGRGSVAQAQAFAAGILPNPQVALEHGFLISGPGTVNAMLAGISQDIVPLLTFEKSDVY